MAGAVSYVHVVVPIELRTTAENAIALRQLLENRFRQRVQAVHNVANKTPIETANDLSRLRVIITDLEETDHLFDRLLTLSQYFPHDFENLTLPPRFSGTFNFSSVTDRTDFQADFDRWFENRWNDPIGFYYHNRPPIVRKARFIPIVAGAAKLGASLFSTINGLYTRAQLREIKKELADIHQDQRKIIKLVSTNAVAIALLDTKLVDTHSATADALMNSPAADHAEVDHITKGLHRALDLLVQVVQEAQKNRLASEFLRPQVLEQTFTDATKAASASGCQMVIESAADLSLVEVSYLADSDGSLLLLHIPIVPADTLLRLLRLIPFPLPLGNSTSSLIPEANIDVIGLSDSGYSTEIRYSDLVECHKIGRTYYCQKQGILGFKVPSCLRALHDKDLTLAVQLCELKVVPQIETVVRITPNRYLVFSPKSLSATRHCASSSLGASVDIPHGISRVEIQSGCWLELDKHHVYADNSIHIGSYQFSYEWKWGSMLSQLEKHPQQFQSFANALNRQTGPLRLQDVLTQAEQIHLDLIRSQDLNSTLTASSHTRHLNTIFSGIAMAMGLFATLALIFSAFYFRARLRQFVGAVKHVFSKMPDLRQILGNNNNSENATSEARLYPNLSSTIYHDLMQFSELIRNQSVRLRRPTAPAAGTIALA